MLIDARHKKWIVATVVLSAAAFGFYHWMDWRTPGRLTGGTTVGLWYGIIGSLLMIYAGLLSALRKVPAWWWLGPRSVWLRGHIWLGLLSVVFILLHSGYRFGGTLEKILWVVFALTIATGIFGLLLQQFLPRMITSRVPCEAPYEQIPHLCKVMRRKAEEALRNIWSTEAQGTLASVQMSQNVLGAKMQLQEFCEKQIWPFLNEKYQRSSLLANPVKAETAFDRLRALPGLNEVKEHLAELEQLCEERRLLAEQERLHHWLHGWLLLHIPLSLALLFLGLAHAFTALYY
ncbi:MAG: hypothetical protein KatS3mg105_2940 [Gemmatales bacterium]|nr:MAG: hypothetical protein KatS3mg105_2940 [Gemmatales bacterium]